MTADWGNPLTYTDPRMQKQALDEQVKAFEVDSETSTIDGARELADHLPAEWDVRPEYSGRFMFGRTCFGIVIPMGVSPFEVARELEVVEESLADATEAPDAEAIFDYIRRTLPTQDSMGMGTIIYWPGLHLV